jgi:hypothetical protein
MQVGSCCLYIEHNGENKIQNVNICKYIEN